MARFVNDAVYDAALTLIKNNADGISLCKGQPTTYAEATTNYGTGSNKKIASESITSSDMTIGEGSVSGRQLTVAEVANISVSVTETADHVALTDSTNSRLLLVVPLVSPVSLNNPGQVTIPSWTYELLDPTA